MLVSVRPFQCECSVLLGIQEGRAENGDGAENGGRKRAENGDGAEWHEVKRHVFG
jgi:hypothetical protein